MSANELLFKEESYSIIGFCIDVYNELGKGFLEVIYKDALEYEFKIRNIPISREQVFDVKYKGIVLRENIMLISFYMIKSFWKLSICHVFLMIISNKH